MGKRYNKKGFTLAEILGVIVIIGLLLLIVTPVIVGRLGNTRETALNASNRLIYNAASQHVLENRNDYPAGKRYCITVRELINEGKLASPVKDVVTGRTVDDNYSVMVSIYSTGNEYYEGPFVDKECEETSSIPMIDFLVEPSGTDWVKSRKVTIKYPDGSSEKKYKIDSGGFQDTNDNNTIITFTKPGVLTATAKYQGSKTESKINIVNIENQQPTITIVGQPTCKKVVTVKLTDEGGSKLKDYAVIKQSACPNDISCLNSADWKKLDRVNEKTIKFTAEDEVNYTIYARDNAGNIKTHTFMPNVRHTVRFNLNGGNPNQTERKLINNQSYSQSGALPTVNRTGYLFQGWFEDNNTFAKQVTDSTIVCVTTENDIKNLYVKWKPITYTVKFNANGGGGTTNSVTCTYDKDCTFTNGFSRTGYTFQGWATTPNGNVAYTTKGKNLSSTQGATVNLYAKWKANEYTVTYNANGGSVNPTNNKQTYDSNYKNLPTPTRSGYRFEGWYTAASGGSLVNQNTKFQTANNNTVLYAHWKDIAPPTCGNWSGESTSWTSGNRTISVQCNDGGSGCQSAWYTAKTYTSGEISTDWVSVRIYDNEGNWADCAKTANVYVDKVGPVYKITEVHATSLVSSDCVGKTSGSCTINAHYVGYWGFHDSASDGGSGVNRKEYKYFHNGYGNQCPNWTSSCGWGGESAADSFNTYGRAIDNVGNISSEVHIWTNFNA